MGSIRLGTRGTYTLLVAPEHLANQFKDATLPPVLATPVMIMTMENAALNALKPYLQPGETALGTAVNVRHTAATPVGQRITAEAEVTLVEGRRIEFKVTVCDEVEEIGPEFGGSRRPGVRISAGSPRPNSEGISRRPGESNLVG